MTYHINLCALALAVLASMYGPSSHALMIDVFARANSIAGGSGAATGVVLTAGEAFSVSVDPNDLWNAGALPRWSNADGLTTPLFATGSDDSGQPLGTQIGAAFGNFNGFGLSLPYGTLVGSIVGNFFAVGTSFSGSAIASGELLLWYWDSNSADNTESVSANVQRVSAAVPEPATLALLAGAIGLGIASGRRRRPRHRVRSGP